MADNVRDSFIRDFNERHPDTKFGDIFTGRVRFSDLSDEQKRDLANIFSKYPGRYDDFMARAEEAFEQRRNQVTNTRVSREGFSALKREQEYRFNFKENMEQFQSFMHTYQMPTMTQQLSINKRNLFTPFDMPSFGTPMFSQHGQTQRLLGYYATPKSSPYSSKPKTDMNIVNDVMNSRMIRSFNDGEIRFQGGAMWSHLDSPAAQSAYSPFSVNAQEYIETFRDFYSRLTNPSARSNGFISLDIETFGSMGKNGLPDEWFHINEIAAEKFTFDPSTGKHVSAGTYSWLTRPTDNLTRDMLKTIEGLKQNPLQFGNLSEAKQRSLVDLMRYSTSSVALNEGLKIDPAQFIEDGDNLNVVQSNATDLNELYSGRNLNHKVIQQNFNSYSEHMISGLRNLRTHGSAIDEVIRKYNKLVEQNKSLYFLTHNGETFDLQGLQKFGGQAPKRHLDWLKLQQSVYANPYQMNQIFGRDKDIGYKAGPWTLEEQGRTLFSNDSEYQKLAGRQHTGAFDVGKFGLGGVVLNTLDSINAQINHGATGERGKLGLREKSPTLQYSEEPVKKGQLFFSTEAVQNWMTDDKGNPLFQDFQAEVVDGKLELINPSINRNVLDAESFYRSNGVRKLPGEDRYALELLNEANGTYSYIIREGENARAQIQQFIQQNLEVADEMTEEGMKAIQQVRMQDLARRRYEDIFGLRQGYTRGFDAAKRIMDNVRVFNENVSGPEGPRTRADLEKLMDFNSLIKGEFNKAEAEQFWHMLPRLRSEYDAFSTAIDEIEEAISMPANAPNWQKREINMQRSLALRRFADELDVKTGGAPREKRDALPYEQHILEFDDRITGRTRTLNLKDTSTAMKSISRYINSGNDVYRDNPQELSQVRREKYLNLLASLDDIGYLGEDGLKTMIDDFYREGENVSIHSKTLAIELSTNLDILDRVKREKIESTSLQARETLKNLETIEITQMAKDASQYALNVRGQEHTAGSRITPYLTPEMENLFNKIDRVHDITGLNPGHRQAISELMERFMSAGPMSHGMGFALTAGLDNNMAYLNIFQDIHTDSVISHLNSGASEVHPNVTRIGIPLIGENGTMRYNNMQINVNSSLILTETGEVEKVSSVRKLTDSFDEGRVYGILRDIKEGDIDRAQWSANQIVKDAVEDLAGIKRNIGGENDTFIFKNTIADAYKQGQVNLSAMVHQYYQSGELQSTPKVNHFRDEAFVNGKLKTYLDRSDLTPAGLEIIDRNKMEWAREALAPYGLEPDMSSVKSDHSALTVGVISAREATPAGMATPHIRDNSVQVANTYAFNQKMQESLTTIEDGTYVRFDGGVTTELQRQLEARLPEGDRQYANILVGLTNDKDLEERLKAMKTTPEGYELLRKEHIILEDGSWNAPRVPTVYEQQVVMNKEIIDRLWMQNTKFYDIDKNFRVAEELIDSAGDFKIGATVRRGQILGRDAYGEAIRFDAADKGTIFVQDGRLGILHGEQAHKLFFDFEKGTVGGGAVDGKLGYSLEFLEALTGIRGVGALYGPDIEKHNDYSSFYRGHLNRVASHIESLSDQDRTDAINRVQSEFMNDGQLGLRIIDKGDTVEIDERWRQAGIKEIDNASFIKMMDDIGLDTVSTITDNTYGLAGREMHTLEQGMYIAQVSDYSDTADSDGGRVRYGPREIDMLRRQGLNATADYITNVIDEMADSVPREGIPHEEWVTQKQTAQGILDAARSIDQRIQPEGGVKVWSASDFTPAPITDSNKATVSRSILDSEWIASQNPDSPHGVWFELPKVSDELTLELEGKQIDRVFLPNVQLQGKGNEVWKGTIQRLNQGIVEAARKLEQTPLQDDKGLANTEALRGARQDLQTNLDRFSSQIRKDLYSSDGFIVKSVLKGQLPNSATGITKIVAPWVSEEMGGAHAFLSNVDLQNMDVDTGQTPYALSLRYPTFHEKALRPVELHGSDYIPEGQQYITANIADDTRADADGDMNHMVVPEDLESQEDLKRAYLRDEQARGQEPVIRNPEQTYNLQTMGNVRDADGNLTRYATELYDPSDIATAQSEIMGKYGKQLVGMASNLNYQWTHLALQYGDAAFGEDEKHYVQAMFDFFEGRQGIEQKIISAKHGANGLIDANTVNPPLQFIEALQRRRWDEALRIDQNLMDGMFSEKANMEDAITAIKRLEQAVPEDQLKHISTRFGLSTVPEELWIGKEKRRISMGAILDIMEGEDVHRISSNQTVAGINRLAGAEIAVAPESLTNVTIEGGNVTQITPPDPHIPSGVSAPKIEVEMPSAYPRYEERGFSKLGSMLESVSHSKLGVGLGIGAAAVSGGLMLTNLTSADKITPESRPHNDETLQSANPPMQIGGTARVEMNDSGLNGMKINVSGNAPGHVSNDQIGGMASQALQSAGLQANVNIRSQDDTTTVNRDWLEQQFTQLITTGHVGGI